MSNIQIVFTEGTEAEAGQLSNTLNYNPTVDTTPGILLGVQAIVGTIWWFISMFVYIKNFNADPDIQVINSSTSTVPILWWWERVNQIDGYYRWHAAGLMMTFIAYGATAFMEMIAWFLYIDSKYVFARFWFSTGGYWMSIFLYPVPVICELIFLILKGSVIFPGSWAVFQLVFGLGIWLFSGLTHILYIDPFTQFIDAREPATCVCKAPEVLPIAEDATQENKLAWAFAIKQRKEQCDILCPLAAIAKICNLKRLILQSDEDYAEACQNVIDEKARLRRRIGNSAVAEDDDESAEDEDVDAKADAGDALEAGNQEETDASDVGSEGWL